MMIQRCAQCGKDHIVDHVYYSIDKQPDACAQAVAGLIKADARDQFEGLRDRFEEAAREMGRRVQESLDRLIFESFTGGGPDMNGDQFAPGCFRKNSWG